MDKDHIEDPIDKKVAEAKLDKDYIELLIDKKVAEAKLEISENRFQLFTKMAAVALTLFGIILPIFHSYRVSDKLEIALNSMKQDISKTSDVMRSDSRLSSESLERAIPVIRADMRAELDGQARQLGSAATKVDSAIQDMNKQFKDLAGTQLRKPLLDCVLKGANLEGEILSFSAEHDKVTIQIKNIGDAPAKNH